MTLKSIFMHILVYNWTHLNIGQLICSTANSLSYVSQKNYSYTLYGIVNPMLNGLGKIPFSPRICQSPTAGRLYNIDKNI